MQIICLQLYHIKYSYQMQIICTQLNVAQSAGTVEYTDCISAEG